MTAYYYLASALPYLEIGHMPKLHFNDFINACKLSLTKKDFEQTKVIRRYIDIANIGAYFLKHPIDHRGNIYQDSIDESIAQCKNFSYYIIDYLEKYETQEERLKYYPLLVATFFQEEIPMSYGFLQRYLRFERDWRIVMTGLRSKELKRDVSVELQYEDPSDVLVANILAQKDSPSYEPPVWFSSLKSLFNGNKHNPLKLHKSLCTYRFEKIEKLMEGDFFSLDQILGYMVQLVIVEQWLDLNEEEGKLIMDTMIKEAT